MRLAHLRAVSDEFAKPQAAAARGPFRSRRFAGTICTAALAFCAVHFGLSAAQADWRDLFRSQSPDEEPESEESREIRPGTSLETPYVGEYVTPFGGTNLIPVEGVGLVVGLDKTGEDPSPSHYRTLLVDEMKKRGIENPNSLLARPDTALVLIRAYVPVNARKGDTFDVEVVLPPNSEATSLAGGFLLEARLAENKVTQGGRLLKGHELATVSGPVLVSITNAKPGSAGVRKGSILGGARSKVDRDLAIYLRSEYKSFRNTTRIAEAIGKRFHGHDKYGVKTPMAEAKTDQMIVLKVPEEYKENYPRYLNVIRNIAFRETEIALRVRMQKLEQQLDVPATSETAALRLEAIGATASPILKRALQHEDVEVRFNAAIAVTYMGHTEGLEALAEAARVEPAFRVYALAALASCKEAEAASVLVNLLHEPIAETRYGAFRALTVLNDDDPIVAGLGMKCGGDEPLYKLHALKVEGPPLIHLTHHTKSEVVLFGSNQRLQLPAALRCGPHIQVVASPGSNEVVVSRYSGGKTGRKAVSPNITEIIMACDELGAKYPDIAALLTQADEQHNLPGELEIDALPEAGRTYLAKNATDGGHAIGNRYTAPPLYAPPSSEAAAAKDEDLRDITVEKRGEGEPKSDSAVRPAGAGDEGGGVVTADAEVPSEDAPAQGEGAAEAAERRAAEGGARWYDPRRFLKKPEWLDGGGPPVQSEPEVE